MLEELVVVNRRVEEHLRPFVQRRAERFSGVPALRTLFLTTTPLPYLPQAPNTLVNLSITGPIFPHPFIFYELLGSNTNLESIYIHADMPTQLFIGFSHPVDLPNLKSLDLNVISPHCIANILLNLTMPLTVSIKISTRLVDRGAFEDIFPSPPSGNVFSEGLRRMELIWNGVRGVALRVYRDPDGLCAPALHIAADWESSNALLRDCFLMNWPFNTSQIETLVVCGNLPTLRAEGRNYRLEGRWWTEMFEDLPQLRTLRLMSFARNEAVAFLEPLSKPIFSDLLCTKLETLECFDIVPAGGEFAQRVYGVTKLRGARPAGGSLKKVELFNAGSLGILVGGILDDAAESEVQILQECEEGSVFVYC